MRVETCLTVNENFRICGMRLQLLNISIFNNTYFGQEKPDWLQSVVQLFKVILDHQRSFIYPFSTLSSSPSPLPSLSAHSESHSVLHSSPSISPANFSNSSVAWSTTSFLFTFGTSNCCRMLLTTKFIIWVKHRVRFVDPGKLSTSVASSSIMASLLVALSQVIDFIYVASWWVINLSLH